MSLNDMVEMINIINKFDFFSIYSKISLGLHQRLIFLIIFYGKHKKNYS